MVIRNIKYSVLGFLVICTSIFLVHFFKMNYSPIGVIISDKLILVYIVACILFFFVNWKKAVWLSAPLILMLGINIISRFGQNDIMNDKFTTGDNTYFIKQNLKSPEQSKYYYNGRMIPQEEFISLLKENGDHKSWLDSNERMKEYGGENSLGHYPLPFVD